MHRQVAQHGIERVPIHIRHKVHAQPRRRKRLQRYAGHAWPEVGPADAQVHHIGDGRIGAHLLGVGQHRIQRGVHFGRIRVS